MKKGEKSGIKLEVSQVVEQLHQLALQKFGAKSGEMSVVKLYEETAGTPFALPSLQSFL